MTQKQNTITVVLLTCSKKPGGLCIAGVDVVTKQWVRLMPEGKQSVPSQHLIYQDGSQAKMLDVVQVVKIRDVPLSYQPENVEYDSNYYWLKVNKASLEDVYGNLRHSPDPYVFFDEEKKLNANFENFIEDNIYSLKMIYLERAVLSVFISSWDGKLKHRLSFDYNGNRYNDLSITDEVFNRKYTNETTELLQNIYIVTSIGEPFEIDNKHYKLVASIF